MSAPTDPGSGDPESEFFALEITPLPPPVRAAGNSPAAHSSHSRISVRSLLLAVGVILLALALLLQSVVRLPTSRSRHLPIQGVSGGLTVLLGAVPSGCPTGNLVYTFSADFAPGAGMAGVDIWLVGFSPSTATLHLGYSPRTKLGWEYPLSLVVNAGLTEPITLQVQPVIAGGGTVWLSRTAVEQATGALTFNPRTDLAHPGGSWKSWQFFVFIASAGCYYVDLHYGMRRTRGTYFAAGE